MINKENTGNKTKTIDEIGEEKYYNGLVDFIIEKQRKEGIISNEEDTKNSIDAMLFLIGMYSLKDLIYNLFEIYDDVSEYDKSIGMEE